MAFTCTHGRTCPPVSCSSFSWAIVWDLFQRKWVLTVSQKWEEWRGELGHWTVCILSVLCCNIYVRRRSDHPCRRRQIEMQCHLEPIVHWSWMKAVQESASEGQQSPTNRPAVCSVRQWRLCVFVCENGKWLFPGRKVKSQCKEKRAKERADHCLSESLWELLLLWQSIVVHSWPDLNTFFSFWCKLIAKTIPFLAILCCVCQTN